MACSSPPSYMEELEEELQKFGAKLLSSPSSSDELLNLIEKVEQLLTMVDQAPPEPIQHALSTTMDALVKPELLHCPDKEVQVSVLYCIHEIARITAPDTPYEDEKMKEIFDLTVSAFARLSEVSTCTRYYTRAAAILDTVARHKTCLVMLDLELDELVVKMFKHFLNNIRPEHPHLVFLGMEIVMTTVIEETEGVSFSLLNTLLNSVRKENKAASTLSWKLGEKVIRNCARKLKRYILKAVKSVGIALGDYTETVSLICHRSAVSQAPGFPDPDEKLVGRRIRVLWPLDATFYEGVVASFDPMRKRHKVSYDDGDEENLNLRKEHWELI